MTRPDSMRAEARSAPLPCTKKRGFAHHWKLSEPEGGKVVGVCRYCRRKREYEMKRQYGGYEIWGMILNDPLPPRTNVGVSSNY